MLANPFTSAPFTSIWMAEFCPDQSATTFQEVQGIQFIKHNFLPLYINIGRTHTKGINYRITNNSSSSLKNKVLLIYDVPSYSNGSNTPPVKLLERKKIRQYPGFAIRLDRFEGIEDFLTQTFGRSSRYKLRKYKKRLEEDHNVQYKIYYGPSSKEEFDIVFEKFKELLERRYKQKKISNNNLEETEWNFYKKLSLPMIQEKKAMLFVIYNKENIPIAITLNYCSEDTFYNGITVYDIDYEKYRVGWTTNLKLIEWCFDRPFKWFDFSKGYFEYKQRWSNLAYDFEYHLIYDKKSFTASILAGIIGLYFRIKQYLRQKDLNKRLNKYKFYLKSFAQADRK